MWWWIVPAVVILGALGYYWYTRSGPEIEKTLVATGISPADKDASSKMRPETGDLGQRGPDSKAVSEKYAHRQALPVDEKTSSKEHPGAGTRPLSKADFLKEMRNATSHQIERLSELGKEDFVKIEKGMERLFESGQDDGTRTGDQSEKFSEVERTDSPRSSGEIERPSELERTDAPRTHGEIERLSELNKADAPKTDGQTKRLFEADKRSLFGKASADEIYCALIEEYITDFFHYLDSERYIKRLDLKSNTYSKFKQILKRLMARPPVPAGEGLQPAIMLTNVYYFSRALDRKDLLLIKDVTAKERDTMELNLEMFYRWLMLGNLCPNPGKVRPAFDVTYRYAGFFLNTTGGRAYLFRRPLSLRILVSYYCTLIVYQADRLGKNIYGLNVFPYIQPLKNEIEHHPEFEFQQNYLEVLNRIESYYLRRR